MARVGIASLTLLLAASGCNGPPTLDDARDLLHAGDPREALLAARLALTAAEPGEQAAIRRVAFDAGLDAGWAHEAAREYLALRQLVGRDDERLLAELARETVRLALASPDASRQLLAVDALRSGVGGREVLLLLDEARRAPDTTLRAAAAAACAHHPDAGAALDQLGDTLEHDAEPRVRLAALRGLLAALDERLEAKEPLDWAGHLAQVKQGLADADVGVRLAALDLLAQLARRGTEAAREGAAALALPLVTHGDDEVALAAGLVLLQVDSVRAAEAWAAAGHDGRQGALGAFGLALAAHAPDTARGDLLAEVFAKGGHAERLAAVRGLRGPGAARRVRQLGQLAAEDPARAVRCAALEALASVSGEEATEAIRRGLEHGDPATRHRALALLAARRAVTAAELRALAEADEALASLAFTVLLRDPALERALLVEALARPSTRLTTLDALRWLEPAGWRPLLVDLLQHPRAEVRTRAALALARHGEPEDRPLLVAALTRPDEAADVAAAAALLELGGPGPEARVPAD